MKTIEQLCTEGLRMLAVKRLTLALTAIGTATLVGCGSADEYSGEESLVKSETSESVANESAQKGPRSDPSQPHAINGRGKSREVLLAKLKDENTADDKFYRMVLELGDLFEFHKFLRANDEKAIRKLYKKHGLKFTRVKDRNKDGKLTIDDMPADQQGSAQTKASPLAWSLFLGTCPQHFGLLVSGETFDFFDGTTVVIDDVGRPLYSSRFFYGPTWIPGTRQPSCQNDVGTWGVPGDVGGHLVADRFGGWGGRGNLVPQNGVFNVGSWQTIENAVDRCAKKSDPFENQFLFVVTPAYINNNDIRPIFISAYMRHVLYYFWGSTAETWTLNNVGEPLETILNKPLAQDFKSFWNYCTTL